MELDPRIKSLSDVLTIFDFEKAKQFIGQKGYFAIALQWFGNIKTCPYGTLTDVCDVVDHTFCMLEDNEYYLHFIPESSLKPIEKKKWKPFANTAEFFEKTGFEAGDTIYVRSKDNGTEYHLVIVGWSKDTLMLGSMERLNFKELFKWFELWDGEDKFEPFGVEE